MRNLLLFIFTIIFLNKSYCQKFTPFLDKNNGLWGIMNNVTNKPVIQGAFNRKIKDYNDSVFVINGGIARNALVDTCGRFIVDFTSTSFLILRTNYLGNSYPYDTINDKRLMEFPFFNPRNEVNLYLYLIDNQQACIPTDYFPCPAWKEKKDKNVPKYLQLIQEGEIQRWNKNIDSAVYYCKQAIEANPNNASVYYWGAHLFIDNAQDKINIKNNEKYSPYYPWIKFCIDKADELETINPYKDWILRDKYKFYKYNLKDYKVAKDIKKRRKELRKNK